MSNNFFKTLFSKYHSKQEYNTLENKYETLVESMKSETWEKILKKLDEDETIVRLRAENKRLREKLKAMR